MMKNLSSIYSTNLISPLNVFALSNAILGETKTMSFKSVLDDTVTENLLKETACTQLKSDISIAENDTAQYD